MSNWPASLPQTAFLGASIGDDDSRLVTGMDAGPSTRRNRFTAIKQSFNAPIVLTGTQLATFNTFYRTTLNNGADAFDWKDPTDDSTVSIAFKAPPVWTAIKPGASADRLWQSTLSLEIQP